MEYYAAERKKDLLPFATVWMELESIKLTLPLDTEIISTLIINHKSQIRLYSSPA